MKKKITVIICFALVALWRQAALLLITLKTPFSRRNRAESAPEEA